jgi:diketogulonate reductase-like aldo/keto reductase
LQYKTLADILEKISVIGQGTGIGGNRAKYTVYTDKHIQALRIGIDAGMTFIDTAAEYGNGQAESTIAKATKNIRKSVFIATKFSPENSSCEGILKSANESLTRLNTDYIDLYQPHWPNPRVPIEESIKAMEQLVKEGKVRHIGLCNFSLIEFKQAQSALREETIVSTQVEYSLFDRSIEKEYLPFCEQNNITTIAYSPLDQGRIVCGDVKKEFLKSLAQKYDMTQAQVVLSWLVSHESVIAIPNSSSPQHILENAKAADLKIEHEDIAKIDSIFANECKYINTDKIRVLSFEDTIQTLDEAIANKMDLAPSPMELSKQIKDGQQIKPVRVKVIGDASGKYSYDLIEGRVRYWAWVIANEANAAIPAYIRQS